MGQHFLPCRCVRLIKARSASCVATSQSLGRGKQMQDFTGERKSLKSTFVKRACLKSGLRRVIRAFHFQLQETPSLWEGLLVTEQR